MKWAMGREELGHLVARILNQCFPLTFSQSSAVARRFTFGVIKLGAALLLAGRITPFACTRDKLIVLSDSCQKNPGLDKNQEMLTG